MFGGIFGEESVAGLLTVSGAHDFVALLLESCLQKQQRCLVVFGDQDLHLVLPSCQ